MIGPDGEASWEMAKRSLNTVIDIHHEVFPDLYDGGGSTFDEDKGYAEWSFENAGGLAAEFAGRA